jgi:hypothetical protein
MCHLSEVMTVINSYKNAPHYHLFTESPPNLENGKDQLQLYLQWEVCASVHILCSIASSESFSINALAQSVVLDVIHIFSPIVLQSPIYLQLSYGHLLFTVLNNWPSVCQNKELTQKAVFREVSRLLSCSTENALDKCKFEILYK